MFAKSPYSSPISGGSGINMYGSYFGPQGTSSPSTSSFTGFGGGGSSTSLGSGASAPFLSHGGNYHHHHSYSNQSGSGANSGGCGGFGCQQFTPPHTQIIGGIPKNPPLPTTSPLSSSSSSGMTSRHQQQQQQQQSPPPQMSSPRQFYSIYSQNSISGTTSPSKTTDSSEPMHYSPIHQGTTSQGYGSPSSYYGMYNYNPNSSTSSPSGGGHNSSYLPSYLLGLDQHYHHSFQSGSGYIPVVSPGGPLKSSLRGGGIDQATFVLGGGNKKSVMFDGSTNFGPDDETNSENGEGKESPAEVLAKVKGPPKHGFGHSTGSSATEFLSSPVMQESYCPRYSEEEISSPTTPTQQQDATGSSSMSSLPGSSSQESPLSNWVTVFGFPNGASSFILTQFSTCGKILRVKSTPGSNWLHLRFSNKIEARRALTKNGKVVGGSIMVGVMNSDPKVVLDAEETPTSEFPSSSSQQPGPSGGILRERNTLLDSSSTDSFKSRLRPLATGSLSTPTTSTFSTPVSIKSYSPFQVIARESIEVDRNADGGGSGHQSLPSASNGIFTKAMEFMFGW